MQKSGFILVNKPAGITSHDVVDRLREITGVRKIGQSGTLDPFATGLLILGIGREATRRLGEFLKKDKEYEAVIRLGAVSDTYDKDGKIEERNVKEFPSRGKVEETLKSFIGEIEQIPPAFSAKKIRGRKLYELARRGIKIEPKPHKVKIYNISLIEYKPPFLKTKVSCSSGTYIRSLANDIGSRLGCGAYLEELCRTRIGEYTLPEAVELERLAEENWKNFIFSL